MKSTSAPLVMLLDIEGTTTPISFVYETLFPYARTHLKEFLEEHARDEGLQQDLNELIKENRIEKSSGAPLMSVDGALSQVYEYLVWLMKEDRKSPALKSIQGKIWEAGYTSGQLKSTLFDDVPKALERWHSEGRRIVIYSSGSVLAQRLIFHYGMFGDLTRWIHAYFDTEVGAKVEAASYLRIAQRLSVMPVEILFVSDSPQELDAAALAGLNVRLAVRPGNRPTSPDVRHPTIFSFDEL
jgi:enolase-phosphatase E1